MQPCDLVVNKEIKVEVKKWYARWRIRQIRNAPTDGHFVLKMPRDEIVAAMEGVFDVLQSAQEAQPTIRNCFRDCGFDLTSDDLAAFHRRINGLSEIAIYKSLLASANFVDFATVDDGASAHDAHLDAALADFDDEFTALQIQSGRLDGKRPAEGGAAALRGGTK